MVKPSEADHARWLVALDDLETELDKTARAMAADAGAGAITVPRGIQWSAPHGLGQIPPALEQRARDVLVNQRKLIRELEETRRVTGQHLAALRAVPPARDADASVYLDVAG